MEQGAQLSQYKEPSNSTLPSWSLQKSPLSKCEPLPSPPAGRFRDTCSLCWRNLRVLVILILCSLILGSTLWGCPLTTFWCQEKAKLRGRPSLSVPTRPLEWGDVNFIHTTDTHGWLLGHQKPAEPEPNGSGTLGDLYSFVTHMKAEADVRGADLLFIDSGDLHDGNGITDGFSEGGVNGHEANEIFADLPYDVLAIGNHELYKYEVALDVYKNFVPKWNGRYLTSNVNITTFSASGTPVTVSLGERFTKFTTARGRNVTAFGVLFDFKDTPRNIHIQSNKELVHESWFQEAIKEAPDFFLLVGHIPVVGNQWPVTFDAIRKVHPDVPIFIFGGHLHIRDCTMLDGRSMALASGRYLETVGWLSSTLRPDSNGNLRMSRRYLDANRLTYQFHTEKSPQTFDTDKGLEINQRLYALAEKFRLDEPFGTAPHTYYLDRVPLESNRSVVSLFVNEVLPTVLGIKNPHRAHIPYFVVTNSGAQRFDVFKGPFTRNDQFVVSPFTNTLMYLSVPFSVAKNVTAKLNEYGAFSSEDVQIQAEMDSGSGSIEKRWKKWRKDQWQLELDNHSHVSEFDRQRYTLGYNTTDSCPGIGDDTPHIRVPYHGAPGYVSYNNVPPITSDSTLVDLIFLEFFAFDAVRAVNELSAMQPSFKNVTISDLKSYGNIKTHEAFGIYAERKWN